jgi:putative ABC transport system permease protein
MTPAQFEHWSCSPYVRSIAYQITEALPGVEAKPIFPVADTEGKILNRVEILMIFLGITALTAATLAVLSMMLAAILERRTEIALFKSLGATDALVAAVFLLESSAIGLLGGLAGYLGGSALAWRLAITLFGVPAVIHWVLLPGAVALALIVTVVGSALPLARGLKVSVATGLRD